MFLHWRRERDDLAYLGGEREVDLVLNRDRPEQLINVAYSVTDATTWNREIANKFQARRVRSKAAQSARSPSART